MLKGPELLAKCGELKGAAKSDLVRTCGYVTTVEGKERLHFTEFYEALLEARDALFWGSTAPVAPRSGGRKRSNVIRANAQGALVVGKAYTGQLGIEAGDEFSIRLGRSGRITLIPRDEDPSNAEGEEPRADATPACEVAAPPEPPIEEEEDEDEEPEEELDAGFPLNPPGNQEDSMGPASAPEVPATTPAPAPEPVMAGSGAW